MSVAAITCRGYGPAAAINLIVVRGFGVGGTPPVVTTDTHDGVWDEELYRRLRKKLRRNVRIEEDTERRTELRQAIERVVKREQPQALQAVTIEPVTQAVTVEPERMPFVAAQLRDMELNLDRTERLLIDMAAAQWKQDQEDEEELEMLLMEIL